MNLKGIINSTHNYNFHSHTQFCDGRATMEAMARAAVASGIEHYGFSPHSPIPIASPCNMKAADVESYIAEYHRIAALPDLGACKFYLSMEIDYLGPEWGPAHDYFKCLPLDYSIGSVHFIPCQSGELIDIDGKFDAFNRRMKDFFHNDIEYVVDTFFHHSFDMVRFGGFDILGHLDKIAQNASQYAPGIEDSTFYRKYILDYFSLLEGSDLLIEINTKARDEHGRFFPDLRYWHDLVDCGLTFVVNSDAHYPERIEASRAEAFQLLQA